MGGREGIRGYIAQALVCILSGLRTLEWDAIALEPDNELEKVDIQWWNGEKFTACQVKSSVGDFQKAETLNILSALISDVPDASKFLVVLLGNSSHKTRQYFSELSGKCDFELQKVFNTTISLEGKLEVQFNSLNLDDSHGLVCNELNRYLSIKGYQVHFNYLELIALGLTAQFSRFATKGTKVSKIDFENDIIRWATFNYPEALLKPNSGIELQFYNPIQKELSSGKPCILRLSDIRDEEEILEKISRLDILFDSINRQKLSQRQFTDEEIKDSNNPFAIIPMIDMRSMFGERQYAGFTQNEIVKTVKLAKKIIQRDLPEDFFDVGNLEESRNYSLAFPFGGNRAFFGSAVEQDKQEKIEEFYWLLVECDDLMTAWDNLRSYLILPLVISNKGDKLHEQIDLQMEIDNNVDILTAGNFPYPKDIDNIELFAEDGGIIESSFQMKRDSIVKEYDFRLIMPAQMNFNLPIGKSKENELNRLRQIVKGIFDYEFIDGHSDKTTLECKFKALKPTDSMALPSFILFRSEGTFSISYSIRSNQGSGYKGNLTIPNDIAGGLE